MRIKERWIHDVEKARIYLENCLSLSQEDILSLELEDFYRRLANRKLQSLEETKIIGLKLQESLKLLLEKINQLSKYDVYEVNSLVLLTNIINIQSEIIDQYWDYIPPSIKVIFTNLYDFAKLDDSFEEKKQKAKQAYKNVGFLKIIKFYIKVKFYDLSKSQDTIQEFRLSLKKYVNLLKSVLDQDAEDEADYQDILEIKKKIENEGTIDWDDLDKL